MSWNMNAGYPRATSNGDYGRFLFTMDNPSGNKQNEGCAPQYSTNGNRMVQHVHYPNCSNYRSSGNNGENQTQGGNQTGMPEYTVEYGEDAVRAALGGNLPDFQAQFQKQYGNGGIGAGDGVTTVPHQQIEMMTNGKNSKVAMIPVVFAENGEDTQPQQPQHQSESCVDEAPAQPAETCPVGQSEKQNPINSKQGILKTTIDAVRKSRSSGPVKYGRNVRPSYWNPKAPNPCRKTVGNVVSETNGSGDNGVSTEYGSNAQEYSVANQMECGSSSPAPLPAYQNSNACGEPYGCANPSSLPQQSQGIAASYQSNQLPVVTTSQRSRSLPPSKKQTYSLCGKCRKCKNLGGESSPTSILTFPKFSGEGRMNSLAQQQKFNTSSNLGQSAKNFRAIRFSSSHRNLTLNM